MSSSGSKPALFYILSVLLVIGFSFIGYKFGGGIGALLNCFISSVIVYYALGIPHEE